MKCFIIFLLFCSPLICRAQNQILVDGLFEEWKDLPVTYTDAEGDADLSGIDFGLLKVYNNVHYIFFLLETGTEINLQDLNDVTIYLDTDNNADTGFSINEIGAEISYNFGSRSGIFFRSSNSYEIFHQDIGLITAPTVTSNQFEIAIKRNTTLSGFQVFRNDDIKIVFKDNKTNGDIMPAPNEVIQYTFTSNSAEPLPAYSIQKLSDSDLRIVSYNVLSNGFFDSSRIPAFTRIFQAIQPDIIGFQEIYEFTSEQVANQLESILPSSNYQQWYNAKEGPDCHAISRYPILESALISGNGAFLLDVPNVETEMLLIVAHPPCCANNVDRQMEVDAMMKFLREAKNGHGPIPIKSGTPIVIVGDMNLVGDHRQLETLLSGDIYDESNYGTDFNPDWDGNHLLDSHPYITNAPFSYTWYDEGSSFSPGKLDYIIYSGSNLMLQNSYSLFTPFLPEDSLHAFNLSTDDVLFASDHLPIVADFQFKNLTAINDATSNQYYSNLTVHPNPSFEMITISFSLPQADFIHLQLINQMGNALTIFPQKNSTYGAHQLKFNTSNLLSGVYYLQLTTSAFIDINKIIIYK